MDLYKPKQWHTQSFLTIAATCLRRYFYQVGCDLIPDGPPSPAPTFGQAIHFSIHHCYDGNLDKALLAFSQVWPAELSDDLYNPLTAKKIFEDFIETHTKGQPIYEPIQSSGWGAELAKEVYNEKISPNEVTFAIDIGLTVPLVGRIDCPGRHRQTGQLWAVDYKTSSRLSVQTLARLEFSPQALCYTLGLRTVTGEKVPGLIVEGIKVNKTVTGTLTHLCYVEDHHLEDFIVWARSLDSQIRSCEEHCYFPKNLAACGDWLECPYKVLCEAPDWKVFLGSFRQREETMS